MSINDIQREATPRVAPIALWVLVAWYLSARVLQVFPGRMPLLIVVSWHVIPLALFALIHGALFYRVRGIITFSVLCLLIGNVFENFSIWTRFPFGHYHFAEVMG
jgi:thiamine transporter ThiT